MPASKLGSKSKKLLLSALLVLATCGGAVAFGPSLLWGDGVDYSRTLSIRASGAFQDAALLNRAWALPVAASYGRAKVDYQHNGSFCGPTSLVNVMHSLGRPATQEQILEGSGVSTVFGFLFGGLPLDRLAELARLKTGRTVTVLRNLTLSGFRGHMVHANDLSRRYVVNFHRVPDLFMEKFGKDLDTLWDEYQNDI